MKEVSDRYKVSTRNEDIDIDVLHNWLTETHWAKDRSRSQVEASVRNCLCFTIHQDGRMIAFARVLTDWTVYGIILDMIVRQDRRGEGLGKMLLQAINDHPKLVGLRQVLWTSRAADFYTKAGFAAKPDLRFLSRNWEDQK